MVEKKLVNLIELLDSIDPTWDNPEIDDSSALLLFKEFDKFKEFEIEPIEFLEFAKEDIKNEDKKSLINSLSNSKRAIDCQVDKILKFLGINAKKMNLRNFPSKLEFLQCLGVFAPQIIGKVIKTRNYLEHEYKCPTVEQVEDSIDIATLFIELSRAKLNHLESIHLLWEGKRAIDIYFEPSTHTFKLNSYGYENILTSSVTSKDKKTYSELLKILISDNKEKYFSQLINDYKLKVDIL